MRRKIFPMLAICLSAFVFSTAALAQQKFNVGVNALQEVPVRPSNGRGSCVVTLNAAETQFTVSCTYSGTTSNVVAAHIHTNGPVGVNSPVRFDFNFTGGTSGTIGPLTFSNVTPAEVANLRAHGWYVNIHTSQFTGGEIRGQVKPATQPFDFDGDGRTDIRVSRPTATGVFTLNSINNGISFNSFVGGTALSSASDDYDGDGRGDLVSLFAQGTSLLWRILQTGTNTVREVQLGLTTDQALPADYDGDGKTDVAVFRRTNGIWYIIRSSDNQTRAEVYGAANDFGMVGDFDKDGINDLTALRGTANGLAWFTRRSSNGVTQVVFWGGGVPAPAVTTIFPFAQVDFDGDGAQDHMVARDPDNTVTGSLVTYFIRRSSDGQPLIFQWGLDTDVRIFGDYDGDGRTDVVARRNINGQLVWFILQSSNNYNTAQQRTVIFGAASDLFVEEIEDTGVPVDNF